MLLWDWYCRKLGLTDLLGHDGKVTSDINFILSPYYRAFSPDRDFLYESLLNSRLLWAMTWNNEYESEYVSWISIWINFHTIFTLAEYVHFESDILYVFLYCTGYHWINSWNKRSLRYINKSQKNNRQLKSPSMEDCQWINTENVKFSKN